MQELHDALKDDIEAIKQKLNIAIAAVAEETSFKMVSFVSCTCWLKL